MTFNILITGVGGQGTVLASRLIAAAAMKRGLDVRTTETIGMAQRGGSVVSHTRIGESIYSPLIPVGAAHAMLALEPAEALRSLRYLRADATMIVCDIAIKPAADMRSAELYDAGAVLNYLKTQITDTIVINGRPLKERSAKTFNVALLGAAVERGIFPFAPEAMLEAISEMPRFKDENITAFENGRRTYDASIGKH